jgi:uncharacterized membrane protein
MFFRKKPLIDPTAQAAIVACISEAEKHTTGEIRVFVEPKTKHTDAIHRAQELFLKLGMTKTERRNAVLVYLAIKDRKFAILGDKEIYEKAGGAEFWHAAADILKQHLKEEKVAEGLSACIRALGTALATHFPYDPAVTKNELPDEIVFGK